MNGRARFDQWFDCKSNWFIQDVTNFAVLPDIGRQLTPLDVNNEGQTEMNVSHEWLYIYINCIYHFRKVWISPRMRVSERNKKKLCSCDWVCVCVHTRTHANNQPVSCHFTLITFFSLDDHPLHSIVVFVSCGLATYTIVVQWTSFDDDDDDDGNGDPSLPLPSPSPLPPPHQMTSSEHIHSHGGGVLQLLH